MRMLISIPDDTYKVLARSVPNGQRSGFISTLIQQRLGTKSTKETNNSFYSELAEIRKYLKRDYSKQDSVKFAKDAWKHIN
ncbi:MAG: hypothetical protein AAB373_06555 [Patescibacteria group bacterium]